MPDRVRTAVLEMRAAERELSHCLSRAMRSGGSPRQHQRLFRQIAATEAKMARLEQELTVG
ncbi:MAG: hypothetical protein J0I12_01455 [Candidatus Eremiobacteraeota bacterium]|nr:hypothetical protein [Candidatus Eremiobacteraeota bacterium]